MATVKLDSTLQKYTSGAAELHFSGNSIADVFVKMFDKFPQFLVAAQENPNLFMVLLNGEAVDTTTAYSCIDSDAVISLESVPCGAYDAATSYVSDALVTASLNWLSQKTATIIAQTLINIAVGLAVNYLLGLAMKALVKDDIGPGGTMSDLQTSPTYTWDGIHNTTATGTPLGMVYGTHLVGGNILNLSTDIVPGSPTSSTHLYVQIGLCEGEVAAITDVRINKSPSSYFADVYTAPNPDYYRLGSQTQSAMPVFGSVSNTYSESRRIVKS